VTTDTEAGQGNKQKLIDELIDLQPGDPIKYGLLNRIAQYDIDHEIHSYYSDSIGFIEGWRIGKLGEIVVEKKGADIMVRKTQHIEKELRP